MPGGVQAVAASAEDGAADGFGAGGAVPGGGGAADGVSGAFSEPG